jgi:hypothetical protein
VATGVPTPTDLGVPGVEPALVVHVGDTLCLLASAGRWTPVARADAQAPYVSAHMEAKPEGVVLVVRNNTPKLLRYRARMQLPGKAGWHETSIIPVRPGIFGFEMWPHPIDALALFEMHSE